jgi:hypothetical protein
MINNNQQYSRNNNRNNEMPPTTIEIQNPSLETDRNQVFDRSGIKNVSFKDDLITVSRNNVPPTLRASITEAKTP